MAQINLTWTDNSDNESGFHIYQSIDGAPESLLSDTPADATAFSVLNVLPGRYGHSVSAFNAAGESVRVRFNTIVVRA